MDFKQVQQHCSLQNLKIHYSVPILEEASSHFHTQLLEDPFNHQNKINQLHNYGCLPTGLLFTNLSK